VFVIYYSPVTAYLSVLENKLSLALSEMVTVQNFVQIRTRGARLQGI